MPAATVYRVKLASIADFPAAFTCSGVGKSGSPALKSTTSTPARRRRSASAATANVGEAVTWERRWANMDDHSGTSVRDVPCEGYYETPAFCLRFIHVSTTGGTRPVTLPPRLKTSLVKRELR